MRPILGIAVSQSALGGANADDIRKRLETLRDNGYDGVLSVECQGRAGMYGKFRSR